jgi:capsular polysaccharide transport system permease protein
MSKEDSSKQDRDAVGEPIAAGPATPRPAQAPGPRLLPSPQGRNPGGAGAVDRGSVRPVRATTGTQPGRPAGSPLAAPRRPEGGEIASLSAATAVQFTPAAWSVEALRIDHATANRRRRRGFILRLLAFVLAPTLLGAAYVYLYATPRYVSEFQITYQSINSPAASGSSSLLGSLLGASAGGSAVDMTRVLWAYLTSDTLLQKVDKELDLRRHYGDPRIDWWDRLQANASREKFLDYFNKRVSIDDMIGGYIVVDVEAFDPKFARATAQAMAAACDEMVKNLTARARQEAVRVAETQLKKTQDRLLKATLAVTNFRNAHVDFNPTKMAGQLDSVVGALESQLAQARATLTSDRNFLSEWTPQIVTLKSQIAGLEKQIEAEKLRLANTASGNSIANETVPYSKLVAEWTALELEQKFATDSYLSAKSAYDLALVNAEQQQSFVETFVQPNLPQHSTSPDPLTWISATFLIALGVYVVGSVLIGSFRDQAGI